MRIGYLSLVFLAAFAAPAPTSAQDDCCYDAYMVGQYDGTKIQLHLSIGSRTYPNICRGNAVAFDVYRATLGAVCGPQVRITEQPIPWSELPCTDNLETFDTFIDDFGVTTNTGYRYEARPVDALRNPATGTGGSIWGDAVVGVVPVGHGQLESNIGGPPPDWVVPCPGECVAGSNVLGGVAAASLPDELLQYVDTGTTLTLYVNGIGVFRPGDSPWLAWLSIVSGNVSPCFIGVAPASWTAVKRLYE